MSTRYGISPLGEIQDSYRWVFDDLDSAKTQAQALAQKHRVDVMVFMVIGNYVPATVWQQEEIG